MAGMGQRFVDAGYTDPKPMIDVLGKPMVFQAIDSMGIDGEYTFIGQDPLFNNMDIINKFVRFREKSGFIGLNFITRGATDTVLKAIDLIDNDIPLIIVNCDQIVKWNPDTFINLLNGSADGVIALFKNSDPKWSFAELDANGNVIRVAEKDPISDNASVGIYGWKRGSDFVKYAKQMIEKDIRVNGEFYICPVYNEAIQDGKTIVSMFVEEMHGLGTPEDLRTYLDQNSTQG